MSVQRLKIVLTLLSLLGLALWGGPHASAVPPPLKVSRVSAFRGQPAHPPVLVANKTQVFVYFSKANPGYEGFVVFRAPGKQLVAKGQESAALSSSFQQITSFPVFASVTAEKQNALGRSTLPQEWQSLEPVQLKKYWDDFLFLGMRADGVVPNFPVMASIGGSLYVDTPPASGQTYTYVVGVMNQRGDVEVFPAQTLEAKPSAVPPPLSVSEYADENEGGVMVAFPRHDAVLGYDVYRAFARMGPFEKQNTALYTRKEFVQKNLINDKPYFYQVKMVDIAGNQSPPSPVVKVVPRDRTPPFPVRGVQAKLTPDNKKAIITWEKNTAADLKGYLVLREDVVWKAPPPEDASGSVPAPAAVASDAPLPVLNKTPLSPSVLTYVDTTFRQGKRYNYYLVAVDKTGNRSLRSSFGHLSSPDLIPPAPPKKLAVKTKNREGITLGWLPNREDDLFGYRVFKGANPNAMAPIGPNVVRAPKNTFTDTLIHANEIYFYKIIALDESENKSKPSEVIKVKAPDTLSPSMPAGLLAKSGDAKVYLRWAAVKDTDLKGYRVLNALAETGPFVPIGKDFGKQVTTHLHKPLKNGQKRWYVVQSVDYSGNLSEATDPALAMPADTKPPVAPAAPTFVVSQSVLTLMVVPNKEKDIAGYRLFRVVEIPTGVPEEVIPEQLFEPSRKEIRIETQKPDVPHWYFLVARDTSENESRDGMKAGPVLIKSQTTP